MRIALLSPHSGTNLGDTTIQESAIQNIRRRLPRALVSGIYLNPPLTAQRHGIPCIQITGFSLEFYSNYRPPEAPALPADRGPAEHRWPDVVRRSVKTLPVLRAAAVTVGRVWGLRHEILHLARSYSFARAQDLIVVSGGGQLDEEWGGPWGHPYALFRWALLARLAGVRFVVLSVGVGYLDHRLSRWFVRGALRLAAYRSFRDQGSKDLLREMRFTRSDLCVPDLVFALQPPAGAVRPRPRGAVRRVGVSPIGYGSPALWPTDKAAVFRRYAGELERFVRWLGGRGYEVVLFATSGVDRLVIAALQEALADGASPATPPSWLRRASDERFEDLLAELSQLDFVVASRLHGVLLSHIVGSPVVAVSFDRKVETHMAEVGQQRYCLDIHSMGHVALQETFELLEREVLRARVEIETAVARFNKAVEDQYDLLAQLAISHEPGA